MNKRPHLYLAGPMTGLPDHNFPAFEAAARQLRSAGYAVTSPHEVPAPDGSTKGTLPWQDYVRADLIAMLTNATALALLHGWEKSRGAMLEHTVAVTLEMPVAPVGTWLRLTQTCTCELLDLSVLSAGGAVHKYARGLSDPDCPIHGKDAPK